ncbi:MAG: undecaprenyl-diphosphate phosphatase [Blautia sp.]
MSLIQVLFFSLLQGITEFLPVSSSGHLAIVQNIWNIDGDTGLLLDTILHMGTLIAVFLAFWTDIRRLFLEFFRILYDLYYNVKTVIYNRKQSEVKRYRKLISNNYRKMILLIFLSTIPTGILGYLLRDSVVLADDSLLAPGIGFLVTAVLLFIVDFFPAGNRIPNNTRYSTALIIGLFQGISVFPGISRLGMTLTACLLCGFNRKFAMKYSFLISIPAVMGAMILELGQLPENTLSLSFAGNYAAAAIVATVTGVFCIRFMLRLIRRIKFRYFSIYCFFAGIVAVACNFLL